MALVQKQFNDLISFTRVSAGGHANAAGNFEMVGPNQPRFDYDPITKLAKGLLIEETRTNLLTNSNNFSAAVWVKSASAILPNSAVAPDGTLTADKLVELETLNSKAVSQLFTPQEGNAYYTLSVFVKEAERSFAFVGFEDVSAGDNFAVIDLRTGSISTAIGSPAATVTPWGNGWYRVFVRFQPTAVRPSTLDVRVSKDGVWANRAYTGDAVSGIHVWGAQVESGVFATSHIPTPADFTNRASTALYRDSSGVLKVAASGMARTNAYEYDSVGVLRPIGLLLEEATTNEVFDSQFQKGTSAGGGSLVDTGFFGEGLSKGYKISAGEGESYAYTQYYQPAVSTAYTLSFFFRYVDGRAPTFGAPSSHSSVLNSFAVTFDGGAVAPVRFKINPVGGGVYRLAVSGVTGATAGSRGFGLWRRHSQGVATNDPELIVTGIQLEKGSFATSYIPTSGAQVTRSADVFSSAQVTRTGDTAEVNIVNPWYNGSEGTLFVEVEPINSNVTNWFASLTDGSLSNVIDVGMTFTYTGRSRVITNGVAQTELSSATKLNKINRLATAYKVDDVAAACNGVVRVDTSAVIPVGINRLGVGRVFNYQYSPGYIRSIKYFPRRLSDEELKVLTA